MPMTKKQITAIFQELTEANCAASLSEGFLFLENGTEIDLVAILTFIQDNSNDLTSSPVDAHNL